MKLKALSTLVITLFASVTFAQAVNPAQIADNFIICSSQSQTQQLMIPMTDANTAVMGQYVVTDAPGSQNVLEMVQLNISNVSYDAQSITLESTSMIDPSRQFNIAATAVGEFNVTPDLKTMVYLGNLNADAFTCVVLTADQLSTMMP